MFRRPSCWWWERENCCPELLALYCLSRFLSRFFISLLLVLKSGFASNPNVLVGRCKYVVLTTLLLSPNFYAFFFLTFNAIPLSPNEVWKIGSHADLTREEAHCIVGQTFSCAFLGTLIDILTPLWVCLLLQSLCLIAMSKNSFFYGHKACFQKFGKIYT